MNKKTETLYRANCECIYGGYYLGIFICERFEKKKINKN